MLLASPTVLVVDTCSPKWLPPNSLSLGWLPVAPCHCDRAHQDQRLGLAQASFKLPLLP